ncbi:hypothetical protein [Phocaeicola coprocola]|uniref:hypothetical protein n=1 Tax=Phocaeicola coprocola TaxID=310298 RepID=UPI003AF055EE
MKVEKNLIEKVANGETVLKGEAVEIAKRIIEEGLITKFKKFAFFYQGDEKEIYDVQDCIIDFRLHGAELNINYLNPNKGKMTIFGITLEESLKRLFDAFTDNNKIMNDLEDRLFTVNGIKGQFKLSYTALHYCFAKGRITEKQCLDMMRI